MQGCQVHATENFEASQIKKRPNFLGGLEKAKPGNPVRMLPLFAEGEIQGNCKCGSVKGGNYEGTSQKVIRLGKNFNN